MEKNINNYFILPIVGVLFLITISCKKWVEVDPPKSSITSSSAFSTNATAIGVLNGVYAQMANQLTIDEKSIVGISLYAGLSGDEMCVLPGLDGPVYQEFYKNQLTMNLNPAPVYSSLYGIINATNYAIEGLENQEIKDGGGLTKSVKNQLIGEAKFMRAFCYFYAVNLYGDVPLILTTNFTQESKQAKVAKVKVYEQMVIDLNDAQKFLSNDFVSNNLVSTTNERVRPTHWAALALLARVYLYMGQYENAEKNATEVINNTTLFGLTALNQVFLKNAKEAIFQLQPVHTGWNTSWGRYFILTTTPSVDPYSASKKYFYLNPDLVNSFELGDPRKSTWLGSITPSGSTATYYYPFKYKKGATQESSVTSSAAMTEYMTVLRMAEQYLIRAEARLMQNKLNEAAADVNLVRSRARNGNMTVLPNVLPTTDLKLAIAQERRVELFTEWGDRWLELKRTNRIDEVMSVVTPRKSGQNWRSYQALYPFSSDDIMRNPALVQNSGY